MEKVVRNLLIGADQTLNCVIWFKGDGFGSPDEAASNLAKFLSNLELSKMLGHRDPRTTMIYYNPTPEELAKKLRGKT